MIAAGIAPVADQADAIATVWRAMFWPNLAIYFSVIAALGWAIWRRRPAGNDALGVRANHTRRWAAGLVGWTIFIAVVLTAYVTVSFVQDRRLLAREPDALQVRITGEQWWWRVEYPDPDPSKGVVTANELHLPSGRMTKLELVSDNVIHSLWIPALNGKMDLIPGRRNELTLTPNREGHYRGECAEFCGLQHAHMVLPVTVESPAAFAAWLVKRRAPAAAPSSVAATRGKVFFEAGPCAMCHAIAGTSAGSNAGPDLTHIADRPTIAAGALPNDPSHMAAWLADPQAHKPGTNMPNLRLRPQDVSDLTVYLTGLR